MSTIQLSMLQAREERRRAYNREWNRRNPEYKKKQRQQVNRELELIRIHRPEFRVPIPGDPWIVMGDRGSVGRWVAIWP